MAVDKLVDSTQLDSDLTSVANAIRTKGGTSANLAFPAGFVEAIGAIATGAEYVSGTFTAPESGSSATLSFGKTFSKYMLFVEMTDDSKIALLASGQSSAKMYAFDAMYQIPTIDNGHPDPCIMSYRVVPTTGVKSYSASTIIEMTGSSFTITNNTIGSGANVFYRGYSYKYYVVEIK